MPLNFSALLNKTTSKGATKATVLKEGDVVHPTVRSDGGHGFVLKLGRVVNASGTYASKKNPINITVEILSKDGEKDTQTLAVTDADGVHLGVTDRVEIDKMLASIESMTIKEIK